MARHKGGPVWLFAYGSLIWRPECTAVERMRGRVHGYHRGLYLWSHEHRGTPEMPGTVFGLDRGGSCSGFAYRLPEDNLDTALYALWKREMPFPSYRPHWLNCRLEDGTQVQALGFVLERHLPSYAGNLPDHVLSRVRQRQRALRHYSRLCRADRACPAQPRHARPQSGGAAQAL